MGSGMRQFKALMRKNFIQWKRQPGCAFCEICCPAVVMFLMVILRNIIDPETFDLSSLAKVRQPSFPGFVWDGQKWGPEGISDMNSDLDPFFVYGEYPNATWHDIFGPYSVTNDYGGPFFFVPQQCLQKYSF